MSLSTENGRLVAALQEALHTAFSADEVQDSTDPLEHFIEWLDEPDKVLDVAGSMIYVWSPVRLDHSNRVFELAIVDYGTFRRMFRAERLER